MKKAKKSELRKAVAYMRYSSANQTNIVSGHTEANTIETQRAAIKECAKQHGFEIVAEYIDAAYSGTNDNRPGFQKMMEDAQTKPAWKYVIAYKPDRFARNMRNALKNEAILDKHGISIKFTDNYVESEGNGNELVTIIRYFMSAELSKNLSANTYNAMKNKSLSAAHCGGKPPLGYDLDETQTLCINKNEAKAVRKIFDMYLSGTSYSNMAKELNDNGFSTKTGGKFTKNSFSSILTQIKYTGTYTWNVREKEKSTGKRNNSSKKPIEEQVIIENGCPAIISKETFEAVSEEMKRRRLTNSNAEGKTRRHYMLSGIKILKCAGCGAYMIGIPDKSHGIEYVRYRCPNHKKGECDTKDIRADMLNEFVSQIIVSRLLKKNEIDGVNKLLSAADTNKELINKQKKLKNAIEQLTNSLEQSGSKAIINRLNQREAELEQINQQLANSKLLKINNEEEYRRVRNRLAKMLMRSAAYDVRCMIQNVVEEINVGIDTVKVKLKV
ncbi:MAG: recombinase family protein [Clostridiales bacterium]|jgi:site-specific DNA recombinase|nr:recombinase family protein [Clostridiales bacterium]